MNNQNAVEENQKLTPKERKFCLNYLGNKQNATQAAKDAGYSHKSAKVSAHEMLRKPHVKAFIQEHLRKVEEKLEITIEWKMKMLKECIERCARGEANIDGTLHPSGLIGAISELNKMQGHHAATKTDNTHKHELGDDLKALVEQYDKEY